ncbi:hypothetical protein PCK2_000117 [Pneumocystis canis]|nr:hypothetical protein PCK2_000117 [Pneumocystis canis]
MSNSIVGEIYHDIICDVIQASQHDFEEYGIDDSVLVELKQIWQTRLATTNVARFPWIEPLTTGTGPNPKIEAPLLSNPSMSAMRAAQQIQQLAQVQQTRFYTETMDFSHEMHKYLPQTDGLIDMSLKDIKNEIVHTRLDDTTNTGLTDTSSNHLTTKEIDASLNESLLRIRHKMQPLDHSVRLSLHLLPSSPPLIQTDGIESDSINSDLDSEPNSNPEDGPEHDDDTQLVLCLYDKVQRTKNKWKCVLKDGECPCKYCGGDPKSWNRKKIGSDQTPTETVHEKSEREIDLNQEGALYRPGEVVWMIQDDPSDEWVVCIIVDRTALSCAHLDGVSSKSYNYRVKTTKTPKKTVQVPQWMLRPLLSRPVSGIKDLEDLCETWSLFDPYVYGVSPKIHCYNGCWMGPEKIWKGDVVRFRQKDNNESSFSIPDDLLVVNAIYKENKSGNILVSGNVWRFMSTPSKIDPSVYIPQKLIRATEVLNIHLGCNSTKDVEFTCALVDIQGRWYEPWLIPKGTILNEVTLKRKVNTRKEALVGDLNIN